MTVFDKITVALFIAVAVGLIVWDVILGLKKEKTESMWLAKWARDWNALPFAFGTLVGHWFMQNPNPHYAWWPYGAVAIALVAAVWDASLRLYVPRWARYPGWWLLVGVLNGYLTWPQRLPPG